MADKNNYTTIRIREDSRMKLEKLREGNFTFSYVIDNLIKHYQGTVTDDVRNIDRERVALELQFSDYKDSFSYYQITFSELKTAEVGQVFSPNVDPNAEVYSCETATVIWRDSDSVLLKVVALVKDEEKVDKFVDVVNVNLF